ncbi:MAG: YibE/F family protein [Erysipelotrichales bacterium]
MKKEKIIYIITIILGALFLVIGHNVASENIIKMKENVNEYKVEKAEVVSVNPKEGENVDFEFFFTEKDDESRHKASQDVKTAEPVKIGDKIYVSQNSDQKDQYVFFDFLRINQLIVLAIVFLILVIVFAGKKGFNTIISLAFTLITLFGIFLPAILSNYNIYLWGAISCIAIVVFTLIIVHGYNKKSLGSGLGTLLGLLFAWGVMQVSSQFFHFTGLVSEDAMYLKFNNFGLDVDIKALFFTTIIIGALGAVMDVAMSISSSLYEFKQLKPEITTKELVKAGIEIGKDILGTMTNTLILAYVGSGFITIIIIVTVNVDLAEVFNKEFLIAQIFEPLIGSFGIVASLPITSVICAYLFNNHVFSKKKEAITSTGQTISVAAELVEDEEDESIKELASELIKEELKDKDDISSEKKDIDNKEALEDDESDKE